MLSLRVHGGDRGIVIVSYHQQTHFLLVDAYSGLAMNLFFRKFNYDGVHFHSDIETDFQQCKPQFPV